MHKGVILLTKADNKEEAKDNIEVFLDGYGNGIVWDWYSIGGRWSGTLNKNTKKFFRKAKKIINKGKKTFISVKDIEDKKEKLQELWESLGETSINPHSRNRYGLKEREIEEDIMKAVNCKEVLKRWEINREKKIETTWKELKKARRTEKGKGTTMSGYYAEVYSNLMYDNFYFDSNLYDTEERTNSLPKDLKGYYAVMIDLHN